MKTVLITGANRGIGGEIARQLHARGWRVFLGVRQVDVGQAAARALGENAFFLPLDVSRLDSISCAAMALRDQVDSLDVLINNAAILLDRNESVLETNPALLEQTLQTNLLGPLRVTQAFVPLLRKSQQPRIINISSGAGQLAEGLQNWAPAYSISKTALNALTQQLASALPDFAVNSVSPGWVKTSMGGEGATRELAEGADTSVWLATEASQDFTGRFVKDRAEIPW